MNDSGDNYHGSGRCSWWSWDGKDEEQETWRVCVVMVAVCEYASSLASNRVLKKVDRYVGR